MAATILAAGAGSRMGRIAKAAIHVGGRAVLEWQVSALRDAGIHDISVIVGPYREQMDALMAHCAVQAVQVQAAVHDGTDAPDLVASQHTALRSHVRDRPGSDLLLMPGDLPCVRSSHLHPLQCAWNARHRDIHALVPVVAGVRGHPVLLSWAAVASMAVAAPGDGGVRGWMRRNPAAVQFLDVDDPAYTQDLDTPEDLQRLGGSITPPLSQR